jgi:FtsP/CotA-like multicopper oxidase with cupredoxin domain
MHGRLFRYHFRVILFAALLLGCFAGTSSGAEFWLRADTFIKTMADGTPVTMWGFVQTDNAFVPLPGQQPSSPGPALTISPGDPSLIIHLRNNLTGPLAEPISLIIPGLTPAPADIAPVRLLPDGRARSFVKETAVAGSNTYTWNNVRPGTFIYQSGSHPAIQVQMGLYGAVKKDNAAGQAYAGVNYDKEVVLFLSEVDPVMHIAVAAGTYGAPPAPTSPVNYDPKYFLINGQSFTTALPSVLAGNSGQRILLRLLNAGLIDYVPVLQGLHLNLVAEDGNLLPYPKAQYSLLLAAGKTLDALITPKQAGKFSIYDRRLYLTNNTVFPGGMLTYLAINSPGVDYNGDGRADVSFYRASMGSWAVTPSSATLPYTVNLGGDPTDKPVPGDYDGDGKTDFAVYRGGTGAWYIIPSSTGSGYTVGWGGGATDIPVAGDYDGDGKTDIAIYRQSEGAWWIIPSSTGLFYGVGWGGDPVNDIPVPGDYDGDGKTDLAIYRVNWGAWYIVPSTTGVPYGVGWGGDPVNDRPVPGDYDGDGKTDIAIYRVHWGAWYIVPSSTGVSYGVGWGGDVVNDNPVPADYDGDGKTDLAIYRQNDGAWWIIPSSTGVSYGVGWGGDPSDVPVNAAIKY